MQMNSNERVLRELLVQYGLKLLDSGLVQGTWGNLSVRLSEDEMLVTPSGIEYPDITPNHIVKVNIGTLEYEGEYKPTSEKFLHAGIYNVREDAGAIIHTHSRYCSIFAACRLPLYVEDMEAVAKIGEVIPVSEYRTPGSKELMKSIVEALLDHSGCLMANHGIVCLGRDIKDAFDIACVTENAAEAYVDRRISY